MGVALWDGRGLVYNFTKNRSLKKYLAFLTSSESPGSLFSTKGKEYNEQVHE